MVSATVKVIDETGLHMKPAGILCRKAVKFHSTVKIKNETGIYNAKSVLSVLGACVRYGDEIELICEGPDEEEALNTLVHDISHKLYKEELMKSYKPTSINSMLAALNQFFEYNGWLECKIKELKIQKRVFLEESKELSKDEYKRLVNAARKQKNERLYVLLQAICSTGIRVSEHRYITVQALKDGYAQIYNKGKVREIFFSDDLKRILLKYCHKNKIENGAIFVTRSGRPLDRSNIWKAMKDLCDDAKVERSKVYPHNLRHLFAVTYYNLKKDIARLADLLGHSSMDTTRIYTMSSGREFKRYFDQMDLVFSNRKNN